MDLIKVFTSMMGVASQVALLRPTVTRGNMDLIFISFAANLIRSAEWLFRGGEHTIGFCGHMLTSAPIDPGVQSSATSPHYQRMQNLYAMARSMTSEDILLSLPSYVSAEYDKANKSLGEIWTYRLHDKSGIAKSSGLLKDIADPLVYSIFALRAASRRISGSIASGISSDAFSLGGLTLLKQAGTALAEEVSILAYTLDDVRQHCTKVLQFYRALDVQPLLKQPEAPIQYVTQVAQGLTPRSVVQGVGNLLVHMATIAAMLIAFTDGSRAS